MASGLQPLAATNLSNRLMQLAYTFDPAIFYLGTLCGRGHKWPSTSQSLRRTYFDKNGTNCSQCVGCTGLKAKDWRLSFVDYPSMGLPIGSRLGNVCKGGHTWRSHELTLRVNGKCIECEKLRARNRCCKEVTKEYQKTWYRKNKELISEKNSAHESRARRNRNTKQHRTRRTSRLCRSKHFELKNLKLPKGYKLTRRKAEIAVDLLTKGNPCNAASLIPLIEGCHQMEQSLARAGQSPSIAQLVINQQQDYWAENPEEARLNAIQQRVNRHRWRQIVDIEYCLYHRQKSSHRRARMRNSTADQLTSKQMRKRFADFNFSCAYCGDVGDLHIEHVHPISKGGPHTISNIVPACRRCNYSKHTSDVVSWYRAQPFFNDLRWQSICAVTDAGLLPFPEQLKLFDFVGCN